MCQGSHGYVGVYGVYVRCGVCQGSHGYVGVYGVGVPR